MKEMSGTCAILLLIVISRLRCLPLFFFLLLFLRCKPVSAINDNDTITAASSSSSSPSPPAIPSPAPPLSQQRSTNNFNYTPFKPGIIVVVAVLTTIFSITFLLLLYAKHCKGRNGFDASDHHHHLNAPAPVGRKNSGIERSVIDSLPLFRFSSLKGKKDGLECAVCLNRFEPAEMLRLLPKCKHAFHTECVDTWFDAHSTCPLCRYRLHPEDILLIPADEDNDNVPDVEAAAAGGGVSTGNSSPAAPPMTSMDESKSVARRLPSERHSSGGERSSGGFDLEIVLQRPSNNDSGRASDSLPSPVPPPRQEATSRSTTRRSLDGLSLFLRRKGKESSGIAGAFGKDGTLAARRRSSDETETEKVRRRVDHRILISNGGGGGEPSCSRRSLSDPEQSTVLYLRSDMIIVNGGGDQVSSPSKRGGDGGCGDGGGRQRRQQPWLHKSLPLRLIRGGGGGGTEEQGWNAGSRRAMINSRCVSEFSGLNRFSNSNAAAAATTTTTRSCSSSTSYRRSHSSSQEPHHHVSRWKTWMSLAMPAVRSGGAAETEA